MADLPGQFWGGWIVVITVVSFIGLGWLVFNVYFTGTEKQQAPDHVWDETLREGTEPAPMWWFWFILALMAASVVYLMLYPGLGQFRGALEWSQGGEIEASLAAYDERFGAERARIAAADVESLAEEQAVMFSASHVFNVNCAVCHGADAQGQVDLFPDLTDDEWQWGGTAEQIQTSIANGRTGIMPPWQSALGDDGVEAMAEFVLAMSRGAHDAPEHAESATRYATYCAACHGANGAGNILLGAPALDNDAWLYGGGLEAIAESIAAGRTGSMPGFSDRLDETQIRMLVAWIADGAEPVESPPP